MVIPSTSFGAEPDSVGRLYIAVGSLSQSVDGDLDGVTYYVDGFRLYMVPEVSSGMGMQVALGGRNHIGSVEAYYGSTSHDASWMGLPLSARRHEVGLCVRWNINPTSSLQYYLMGAPFFQFLVVPEGVFFSVDETIEREKFSGWGGKLGPGLRYNLTPMFAVRGEASYALFRFTSLAGRDLDDFTGSGFSWSVGLSYALERLKGI